MERAESLIHKICRLNKLSLPKDTLELLKKDCLEYKDLSSAPVRDYNVLHLFRTPRLRKRTFVLLYIWLVIATCYYGVTFKMPQFKVNRYLLFFISGVIETVVYFCSLPLMNNFGRKKLLSSSVFVAGLMCVASGCVNDLIENMDTLTASLAMVGKCCLALGFAVIFVYTSELYPTVIRNIGVGFACFWARVGGVLAPQINQFTRDVVGFDAIILFGVLSLFAAFSLLLLEETHNTNLPSSIEEVEGSAVLTEEVGMDGIPKEDSEETDACLKPNKSII